MSMLDIDLIQVGEVFRGKGVVSKNRLRRVDEIKAPGGFFIPTIYYSQSLDGGVTWTPGRWSICVVSFRRWAGEEVKP